VRQSSVDEHIDGWQDVEHSFSGRPLMGPLRIMHDSLIETALIWWPWFAGGGYYSAGFRLWHVFGTTGYS
jgi:hypothetical protein